ncbi:MAG: DNA cytosine methyltransferase [Saprospiraceae bacterium]
MNHLGLFEGIGGFSLAARWMGWKTIAWVEKDIFCQKVLNKNFPNAKEHGDIKYFDGAKYQGKIDIITGGFPCQPFSTAGNRKGKNDNRYLWDEMFRVICEVKPSVVVGENVLGITSMENGETFEKIHIDLESKGYKVQSFVIPSAGVGAIHRRYRVWIIAYSESNFNNVTKSKLTEHSEQQESKLGNGSFELPTFKPFRGDIYQPCFYRGNDGFSKRLDRNRALGNAIVPQVAFEIFKIIKEFLKNEQDTF